MDESRTYTVEEVSAIISQLHAKTSDYLILAFFQIHNISDGPLYIKHRRRLNNIILNNFTDIYPRLLASVLYRKSEDILQMDLASVRCLSCIFPTNLSGYLYPVLVQYFDPKKGIVHRLLGYTGRTSELSLVLNRYDIMNNIVGYCGDYSYKDSANTMRASDHLTSLYVLSGNRLRNLPYSDGFKENLINLLVDYLPTDVNNALVKLGETLMAMSGNSSLAKELVYYYKEWLRSRKHIISSTYAKLVIDNFDAINRYLEPYKCLPASIVTLFSSVLNRFLVIFVRKIYREIDKIKLTDNTAVCYYSYLIKVRDMFEVFEDETNIPAKAMKYFNDEIDSLIENKQVHPVDDKSKLDDLFVEILVIVTSTYGRAVKYIEPLLNQFVYFGHFTWILLEELTIAVDELHGAYHAIKHPASCEECEPLFEELRIINTVLTNLPLLEIDSVVEKWVLVFKECDQIPVILEMVGYVLSLPSTCEVLKDLECNSQFKCLERVVRANLNQEEAVERVEEFYGEYMEMAEEIVRRGHISLFID